MNQFDFEEDNEISFTKTHAEILEMIEEIKKYENKFQKFPLEIIESDEELIDVEPEEIEFTEIENDIVHFIEVDQDKLEQFGLVKLNQGKQKKKVKKRIKFRFVNPKKKDENKIDEIRVNNPTIFKLRFNKEGKLINTELKAPKTPPNTKKGKFLKKIRIKRGKKSKKEISEEKEKTSKIKGVLSKLGRLKKAIPTKSNKEKKSEKTEEEE